MQATQATQAHRAPHCKHVLSRARCVVHLGPTVTHSFSLNTATPIRSCPPDHPYLCGVVLTTDTCHPSTISTRAVAPHLQAVSHTAAQYRDAFVRPPDKNSPDCQMAQGFAVCYPHAETTTQSSPKVCRHGQHGRTSWATSSPPRQCMSLSQGPGSTRTLEYRPRFSRHDPSCM